ncbi:hypothetical protein CRE_14167 [Caenorhabditis remanei]|uniref:Uncharacterized protein n=1 Tax=Caenorhabditis remanei TaxID=31234 RepID=E3MRL9_CAERE|nr:hypothetical protein CRE_14167 [Caenorhabditis remanei]
MPAYAIDKKVLEKSFCWYNHESVHPMFKNVELPSPTKLGALVSYQVSHTCSTDKKPDCVFLDYGFYAPYGEETKFPPHELGIEQGRGECPDWKVNQ